MNEAVNQRSLTVKIMARIARMGTRTITAMVAALLAAVLLFLSPEIGLASAIGGVFVGAVSAVLLRPHGHV
jgi:hypothetical protein